MSVGAYLSISQSIDHLISQPKADVHELQVRSIQMKSSTIVLLAASLLIVGCYGSRTSTEICDCQFQNSITDGLLRSHEKPPPNFFESQLQGILPQEYVETFNGATIDWYQQPNGISVACVVFRESDRVNGTLEFSADESIAEPTDVRWLGIPFGRERQPWEKC